MTGRHIGAVPAQRSPATGCSCDGKNGLLYATWHTAGRHARSPGEDGAGAAARKAEGPPAPGFAGRLI